MLYVLKVFHSMKQLCEVDSVVTPLVAEENTEATRGCSCCGGAGPGSLAGASHASLGPAEPPARAIPQRCHLA